MIRVAAHAAWEDTDDAVLVMDLRSGDVVRLDGTARTLWLLAPGLDREALVTAAAEAYGAAPDDVRDDVLAWLATMEGLLSDEP